MFFDVFDKLTPKIALEKNYFIGFIGKKFTCKYILEYFLFA